MVINCRLNWKKCGLVLLALVILLSAAGILTGGNGERAVSDSAAVPEMQDGLDTSISKILSEKEENSFFAEYRMERERLRSKQAEMLKEIMTGESSSQEAKDAAALRLVKVSEDMEREMKAETLVKAQGYEDCAVIIQAETTTVVVLSTTLRLDQEEEIKKIVARAVQCSNESICIITKEK